MFPNLSGLDAELLPNPPRLTNEVFAISAGTKASTPRRYGGLIAIAAVVQPCIGVL